ncbi:helicase-associated domain-containing protein [Luedemannella flava]
MDAGKPKRDVLGALLAAAEDGGPVRALLAHAPEPVRELLNHVAWQGPAVVENGYPHAVARPEVGWAVHHGLLVREAWDSAVMPAEIAVALRGPGWRPPFDPHPPAVRTAPVADELLRRESAAAATAALDRAGAVLAAAAEAPVALLKSGGVGSRELKRLAKVSGSPVADARLWLEIGYSGGLLAIEETAALATGEYDRWLRAEPTERLADLVAAWWHLPAAPTGAGGRGGGAWVAAGVTGAAVPDAGSTPALLRDATGTVLAMLRQAVLRSVAALPAGSGVADPADVARLVRWQVPAVMDLLPDGDAFTAACWQEAGALGIVAHGALTPLGAALVADDPEALRAAGRDLLGAATTTATFQADLTVVVPGAAAGELGDLLDSAADRESRGAASVWRFSAASVRRALDAGLDGGALASALTAASATGTLPQPLTYLIADAARRHGEVRDGPSAASCTAPTPPCSRSWSWPGRWPPWGSSSSRPPCSPAPSARPRPWPRSARVGTLPPPRTPPAPSSWSGSPRAVRARWPGSRTAPTHRRPGPWTSRAPSAWRRPCSPARRTRSRSACAARRRCPLRAGPSRAWRTSTSTTRRRTRSCWRSSAPTRPACRRRRSTCSPTRSPPRRPSRSRTGTPRAT